jgi:hypothetical protein
MGRNWCLRPAPRETSLLTGTIDAPVKIERSAGPGFRESSESRLVPVGNIPCEGSFTTLSRTWYTGFAIYDSPFREDKEARLGVTRSLKSTGELCLDCEKFCALTVRLGFGVPRRRPPTGRRKSGGGFGLARSAKPSQARR